MRPTADSFSDFGIGCSFFAFKWLVPVQCFGFAQPSDAGFAIEQLQDWAYVAETRAAWTSLTVIVESPSQRSIIRYVSVEADWVERTGNGLFGNRGDGTVSISSRELPIAP